MDRKSLIKSSIDKEIYEINPIVAIPYASSVYSISLTKGPKWLFTGGEDGIIRKYDFFHSVEGKSLLTVSQRHQLIDSILFNGMICSYWENEIPFYKSEINSTTSASSSSTTTTTADSSAFFEPKLSPVYSLCSDLNGFWLLSGLQNGSITLQSIRSSEGSIQWYFKNSFDKSVSIENRKYFHSNTVSCLITNSDQTNFLSGSWDRKILKWDLNTGKNINIFDKSTGQISSLQYRPIIGTDLNWQPIEDDELSAGDNNNNEEEDDDDDMGSLFDDDDDDDDNNQKPTTSNNDIDIDIEKKSPVKDLNNENQIESKVSENPQVKRDITKLQRDSLQTGKYEGAQLSNDIFLSSSIDGSMNIWDSRITYKSNCVCKLPVMSNTPPWCTNATWSVDGDSVFVGRRNSTIENYDIRFPTKINKLLKFPAASGSISCVRTLPNKNYLLCGCQDNIRLYDLRLYEDNNNSSSKKSSSKVPFTIIPGHNGGILSDMYVDPTCRFMISASGNRGWQGKPSDYVYIYEFL
ncbi:Transcription factor spt8 [Pichia californica]|nr:Transcription factor spt8 [[Candida] californica]